MYSYQIVYSYYSSTVIISREYSQFSYPWLQQNHTIPHVEIEIDKNGKLTDFKKIFLLDSTCVQDNFSEKRRLDCNQS